MGDMANIANPAMPHSMTDSGIGGIITEASTPVNAQSTPNNPAPSPSTTPAAPHGGSMAEVTVTAPEKKIVSKSSRLISPPPAEPMKGYIKPVGSMYDVKGVKGPGFAGRFPTSASATAAYNQKYQPNVYTEELQTNTGTNIPIGTTGQTPAARLAHSSPQNNGANAAQMIGREGSLEDIQSVGKFAPIPTDQSTQAAVEAMPQTVVQKLVSPTKKRK